MKLRGSAEADSDSMKPSREEVVERIRRSDGARKFLDPSIVDFQEQDFQKCLD